ncbi:LuxR C-terminal-related transcriptional regulator [Candidatus Caldatribacterium sp.]|uniref:helix-turn-helix transcriptional regulator n=1 Tax=Candidatus Caldatribacterium sp. TaxID=2282143 RepID=UPI002996DE63|nr:LuxR C-terminal-related transcriptional regulator [Candidatus Caldatribacterium sp.]MDW8080337.1 LuxR C-terminal-related transcriptional regulator [Candidatus Calescibacterium sp.]
MEILFRALSATWDSLPDGVSILDASFSIVAMNATMRTWYAHRKPHQGAKCFEIYHGRNRPCPQCPTRHALRSKNATTGIVPYHGPGGTIKGWQKLTVFPLSMEGKIVGFIEYVEDVTERKYLEEERECLRNRVRFLEGEVELLNALLFRERENHKERWRFFMTNIEPLFTMLSSSLPHGFQKALLGTIQAAVAQLLNGQNTPTLLPLTSREWEVAKLLAQGYTSKEIADILTISKKTVDFHRQNIRKKLSFANSPSLLAFLHSLKKT